MTVTTTYPEHIEDTPTLFEKMGELLRTATQGIRKRVRDTLERTENSKNAFYEEEDAGGWSNPYHYKFSDIQEEHQNMEKNETPSEDFIKLKENLVKLKEKAKNSSHISSVEYGEEAGIAWLRLNFHSAIKTVYLIDAPEGVKVYIDGEESDKVGFNMAYINLSSDIQNGYRSNNVIFHDSA